MPKEEKHNRFAPIRSMFLDGSIKKMKDIEKLSPTHVAIALRVNHSRYIQKLYHPEEFTVQHLMDLSNLLDVEINVIWEVIKKQISSSLKSAKKK